MTPQTLSREKIEAAPPQIRSTLFQPGNTRFLNRKTHGTQLISKLTDAMSDVEGRPDPNCSCKPPCKTLLIHMVVRAFKSDKFLAVIANKLIPDAKLRDASQQILFVQAITTMLMQRFPSDEDRQRLVDKLQEVAAKKIQLDSSLEETSREETVIEAAPVNFPDAPFENVPPPTDTNLLVAASTTPLSSANPSRKNAT